MTTATMSSVSDYQPVGHLDNVKARARDLLTCALCVKTFTDPRVLPCQHSFCRPCLQTYIDNILAADVASRAAAAASRPANLPLVTRRRAVGSFACPACCVDVGLPPNGASAFPVDERIQRIRELAIDEMARNISKRLGIGRVASAPDNYERSVADNNNKIDSNKNGIKGRQHFATVGRQFSWSSSRLGNIDEVDGHGGGSRFGADGIDEDENEEDRNWESSAFGERSHGASTMFDRFGRRKLGYSSMRESRHSHRPTLDSMYSTPEPENIRGKIYDNFFHGSDNDVRHSSPQRNENGSVNDLTDFDYERSFGRSKPLHEQLRSFSQTEIREAPAAMSTKTTKPSVSTSSAFRNPYGDDDDSSYTPIIGRHRGSQPLLGSSSLRDRRRRAGFDPDVTFNHDEDSSKNGERRGVSATAPDSPDSWRRFYVASVGSDFVDFMDRRQQQHRNQKWSDSEESSQNEDAKLNRFPTTNGAGSSVDKDGSDKTSSRPDGIRLDTHSSASGLLSKISDGIRLQEGHKVKANSENDLINGTVIDPSPANNCALSSTKTADSSVGNDNYKNGYTELTTTEQIASSHRHHNVTTQDGKQSILSHATSSSATGHHRPDVIKQCNGNSPLNEHTSESFITSASSTVEQSFCIDGSDASPEPVKSPLSPQRPISPTKDSCFSRLTKFRQISVGSPRLRSRSTATSSGSEESGVASPGPESPTRMNPTVPDKIPGANTSGPHTAVKMPASSGGANRSNANRPLTKDRVRKRPSLFVGTPFNAPEDSAATSPTVNGHDINKTNSRSNSVDFVNTVLTTEPVQASIDRPSSASTGNATSFTYRPVSGTSFNVNVTDQRELNDVTMNNADQIEKLREMPTEDEKWGASDVRVSSMSGTSGLGSMSDEHSGGSCPMTPAATVSLEPGSPQSDARSRRAVEGADVFHNDIPESIRQDTSAKSGPSTGPKTMKVNSTTSSSFHFDRVAFDHLAKLHSEAPTTAITDLHGGRVNPVQDDDRRQKPEMNPSLQLVTEREAVDVDSALFELDSVLDLHVDGRPSTLIGTSVAEVPSTRVAPLAACDDSDDLNVVFGMDGRVTGTVGSSDTNDLVANDHTTSYGTRTWQCKVSVKPVCREVNEDGGRTHRPERGADRQNEMHHGDIFVKSTGNARHESKLLSNGDEHEVKASTRLIDSSPSERSPPSPTRSDSPTQTSTTTDAELKSKLKPKAPDTADGTGLKSPRSFERDRCDDDEDLNIGYVMATGVTSLTDGSLIVADYGAGCLCLFEEEKTNANEHNNDDGTDGKSQPGVGRVQHRLSGLKPFSVASNFEGGQGGLIYVGDRRRKTISVFDQYLSDVAQWPDNRFDWICGIAELPSTDAGAGVVVIDRSRPRHQLVLYTADGRGPITELGPHGNGDAELCMAEFVTVDRRRGRVIVADSGNHCLKAFDPRSGRAAVGRLGDRAARRGAGDGGEMQWPKGLVIDEQSPGGVVYVADSRNGRVLAFDAGDGRCIGTAVGGLRGPYAVAVVPPSSRVPLSNGAHTRLAVTAFTLGGQSEVRLFDVSL